MRQNGLKMPLSVKFLLKYHGKFGGKGESVYLCTRF
jgi:hypothetical protein